MVTNGFETLTRPLVSLFENRPEVTFAAVGIAALCVAVATVQVTAAPPPLAVSNAWMRSVGPSAPAAAYFTLSNLSARSRVLVGVSSPDCGKLMMHQSREVSRVAVMTVVANRIVPSHSRIVFAPGGFHLMCVSPSKAVRPGAHILITLRFSDGQRLRVPFLVRPLIPNATG